MTYISSTSAKYARPAQKRTSVLSILTLWRSRQHLKSLDDRALQDIGLTRAEADAEATRPIWDVPHTWRD